MKKQFTLILLLIASISWAQSNSKKADDLKREKDFNALLLNLKELKNAGLIKGTVEGTTSCYCINWKAFDQFGSSFSSLFDHIQEQNEKSCC